MNLSTMPPKWNDPTFIAGTMIRTALWLIGEVGVGNSFTKEKHRAAFPGVAQADRRLRDLRKHGWVIHTSAQDASLNPEEQRFVAVGAPVWEREARKASETKGVTAKARMAALYENDFQCVVCGIAAGELYADAPHMRAVLTLSRRAVTVAQGEAETMLVSECNRCRAGATERVFDLPGLLTEIASLDAADRALFARWTDRGRRSALDRAWAGFRQLPEIAREKVREQLRSQ